MPQRQGGVRRIFTDTAPPRQKTTDGAGRRHPSASQERPPGRPPAAVKGAMSAAILRAMAMAMVLTLPPAKSALPARQRLWLTRAERFRTAPYHLHHPHHPALASATAPPDRLERATNARLRGKALITGQITVPTTIRVMVAPMVVTGRKALNRLRYFLV